MLLTRPPLELKTLVRLACVKHTASVHPEPGSNSLKISLISNIIEILFTSIILSNKDVGIFLILKKLSFNNLNT